MRYNKIFKKIIQIIIILLGISFITFSLITLAPGDAATAMFAASGIIPDPETLKQTQNAMGLDKPFLIQYWDWLSNCLKGNFGISYSMNRPVLEILTEYFVPTLKLMICSIFLMIIISVPLGIIAALKSNKFIDYFIRFISFIGISVPGFWIGIILLLIFSVKLGWFPVISNGNGWKQIVLPSVTLAISMTSKYTRQVRNAVLEELKQDYIIGARARGLKKSTILWNHIFKNSMIPLTTLLGLSIGSLLGGTAVIEVVFSYKGLGSLAVSAITARDYPLIQGYVLLIAIIYMFINLIVDFSYSFLDPRTKERY